MGLMQFNFHCVGAVVFVAFIAEEEFFSKRFKVIILQCLDTLVVHVGAGVFEFYDITNCRIFLFYAAFYVL